MEQQFAEQVTGQFWWGLAREPGIFRWFAKGIIRQTLTDHFTESATSARDTYTALVYARLANAVCGNGKTVNEPC